MATRMSSWAAAEVTMPNPRRALSLLAVAACSLGPAATRAQVQPFGPEFQVNVYTSGWQLSPAVSAANDGTFSVVWTCESCAADGPILGRRFDASGVPLGGELPMSQFGGNWPSDVGADAAGNFVLVWGQGWPGPGGGGSDYVKGRRFGPDAAPRGDQFVIGEPPGGEYVGFGRVAVHADGGFVVAWQDYGLFARRFDVDGQALGAAFQVGGFTSYAWQAGVADEADGGFFVTWNESAPPPYGGLRGQRYDADANPAGPTVTIGATNRSRGNDIAPESDGTFVVVWSSYYEGDVQVMARHLDEDGQPLGPEFLINNYPTNDHGFDLNVEVAPDDTFVVSWSGYGSPGSDSSSWSAQARRLDADGTPLGSQFQVNSLTTGYQSDPWVAFQPDGDFVVVWTSDFSTGGDDSGSSIQARRFHVPFFIDGFETGDTSRWTASMPSRLLEVIPADVGDGVAVAFGVEEEDAFRLRHRAHR